MAYNPYDAVNAIYNFKKQWHTADAKGDKTTADDVAKKAQEYYKQLNDNGYSDLANNLSNTNDVGAKAIVDYLAKNSAPTVKTTTSTPVATPTPTSIQGKIDNLYGIQVNDRNVMAGKYDTLEDYNYNYNPYESEIGKSIMEDYKFKGKTASDNAVASGGASNGGNIDSYAAANANRQRLAFTNAGKQAVLNDFNTRIQNAKDILTNLGVYQQNQDKGMQTTIEQQQNEEQRVFDNEQTAMNNDVARKQTISEVTGYAPDEWVTANNIFLDDNGKLKPEYENVDFKAIMATAKDENVRKQASVARAVKIFSNYEKYGQHDDGDYTLPGAQQTEAGRQFDTTANLTKDEIDAGLEKTYAQTATEKYIADNSLAGNKYASDKALEGDKYKADKALEAEAYGEQPTFEDFVKDIKLSSKDKGTKGFVNKVLKDYWDEGADVILESAETDEKGNDVKYPKGKLPLKTLLIDKAQEYQISAEGAKEISSAFGFSPAWVDDYKDIWYSLDDDPTD